jgi:hypothetical protein
MLGGELSTPIVSVLREQSVNRRALLAGAARIAVGGGVMAALGGRLAGVALAQEATPAAGEYQELVITATDTEFTTSVNQISPGYVLLTVENQGTMPANAALLTLPGLSEETFTALSATPTAADEFPEFLYTATIAGGPQDANPGERSQAYVHVTPGLWVVFGEYAQAPIPITVTDGAEVGAEPASSITVQEPDFLFAGLDAAIPAGKQTWKVVNTGSQLHMLVVGHVPDGTTLEMVMDVVMRDETATPAPGQLGEADFQFLGGVLLQSPGQTVWPVLDLPAGRYAALCWVPDPEKGGLPHAMEGMVAVFDVGA